MSDPLRLVWDALAARDCQPHGATYDFRAMCPAHDGDNPGSLHVRIGADGRAAVWCHAHQCAVEDIVKALGLEMCDLFPAGHHHARRRRLRDARRDGFHGNARTVVNVLAALEQLDAEWSLELRTDCTYCGSPRALLCASRRGGVWLSCPADEHAFELGYGACTLEQFRQSLAGRLGDRPEAA
jgi:hypothetical protein